MISTISLLIAGVITGVFCGAVGVGGILIVPSLVLFGRLTIHEAIATALFAFIFLGLQGAWLYMRRGHVDWSLTVPVCGGAVFFSFLGAWSNTFISARPLTVLVGLLVIIAGVNILRDAARPASVANDDKTPRHRFRPPRLKSLLGIGVVSGFASGLTGAGGPLFSIPLMLLFDFPVLPTIATGQVLVAASSTFASLSNVVHGAITYRAVVLILPALFLGMWLGARVAHRIELVRLKKSVALFCILLGALMLYGSWSQ